MELVEQFSPSLLIFFIMKQVIDFLRKFLPSAHCDCGFLRAKIIRHLQYLRKRPLPSKSLVVASDVELEEDFNDVSDIDVRYAKKRPVVQSSPGFSVSPNGSAMAAPKADEDDTEADAQAEEKFGASNSSSLRPARQAPRRERSLHDRQRSPSLMTPTLQPLLTSTPMTRSQELPSSRRPAKAVPSISRTS